MICIIHLTKITPETDSAPTNLKLAKSLIYNTFKTKHISESKIIIPYQHFLILKSESISGNPISQFVFNRIISIITHQISAFIRIDSMVIKFLKNGIQFVINNILGFLLVALARLLKNMGIIHASELASPTLRKVRRLILLSSIKNSFFS